jgi:diguanylate cyclase (GGDEF)-like protein/PAS domain S-box-containing protein
MPQPVAVSARERTTQSDSGSRHLMLVMAFTAVVLVAAGVLGGIRAAARDRDEVVELLRAVVAVKTEQWSSWRIERRAEAEGHRADAALIQAIRLWHRAPDDTARDALQARLDQICRPPRCLGAALLDSNGMSVFQTGTSQSPAAGLHDLIARAQTGSRLQALAPTSERGGIEELAWQVVVPLGAGMPVVLALRFDARPVVARMLVPEERLGVEGVRVVLTRRIDGALQHLESLPTVNAPAVRLALSAGSDPAAWTAGAPFEGVDRNGEPLLGVAEAPDDLGWAVAAYIERQRLRARAWADTLWIIGADGAALALAAFAVFCLHQRRQLRAAQRRSDQQQERMRTLGLLEGIASGTTDLIFAKDLQDRYVFANEATCRTLGHAAGELIGRDSNAFFPAEDARHVRRLNAEVVEAGRVLCSEGELTTALGLRRFLRTMGPLRDADGRIFGTFGMLRDVTELRQQEELQRQWAKAFEATRDGVMIANARGRIVTVNRAFSEITGYGAEEAVGQGAGLLRSGRHDGGFYRGLWRTLNETGHWGGEIWNRRKNGEIYPEWLTISAVHDEGGQIVNYVGVFTDISRAKRDEAELQRLANCDLLTELPNRRLLQVSLEQALAHAQRHGGRTAVLYIDLDGFKTVNDSLGHPAGDELLVRIAERLKTRVRAEDTLGRLGGDEFLVIVESLHSSDDAAALARDLLVAIAQPVALSGGREAYVTASIGISLHPDDQAGSATEMLRDADAAMYRAKEQGRNRFCFYTHELNAQAVSKLETEAALSRALERDELLLHYQPKVDAKGGCIAGAEALLRWQRQGQLVPPSRFIPLAEHSGLIQEIGSWVIDRACRQIREWSDRGLAVPRIAVNVAARQFAAGDLDRVVREALQRHGVPARLLELELTESMLIHEPRAGAAMLQRLKDTGVTLSLDDFGTGYSSLGYLRQFPIDALKIDKSFVDEIGLNPDGSAIVDAVIALAHRLGLAVVAEGVETQQQRDYLERQGCDLLQGYLLGRPVPAEAFMALIGCPAAVAVAG